MTNRVHEVGIALKRYGCFDIGLEQPEIERMIQDWKGHQTAYTTYKGFHLVEPGRIDKTCGRSLCFRPSHITSVTVDGVPATFD